MTTLNDILRSIYPEYDKAEREKAEKAANLIMRNHLLSVSKAAFDVMRGLDRIPRQDAPTTGPEITVPAEMFIQIQVALCKFDAARKLVEEAEGEIWSVVIDLCEGAEKNAA